MRKLTCVAVAAVLLSQAFVCEAKLTVPTIDDLPVLSLQNAQKTACSRTANYFLRAHYKPVELNKDFADDIIDQYLSFLDSYFDSFSWHRLSCYSFNARSKKWTFGCVECI